jgi:hypothetical protein
VPEVSASVARKEEDGCNRRQSSSQQPRASQPSKKKTNDHPATAKNTK